MKKLSLKKLNLKANDLLEKNQLKTVFGGNGGYGTGSCSVGPCGSGTFACCEATMSGPSCSCKNLLDFCNGGVPSEYPDKCDLTVS